jgi:hypothetical protein
MAASPSLITAVQPYDGQQLSESPQQLVITFNDQVPVPLLMSTFDVVLVEVNRDGTTTPLWDANTAPLEETDATGTELIIPMQTYDPSTFGYDNLTLVAGRYEVELVGGTGISYAASGAFGAGSQLWDPDQNHTISGFSILGQGATISQATPLNGIGSSIQTFWGTLNPDQAQSAVSLYQFTLPQGHFWQVGLSVAAHSIGSQLLPALSLLDSRGKLIATSNAGQGVPSDPDDPYLFEGLKPGTYYVAVSDAGNLPYGPTGFDPVYGIPGTGGLRQTGGPFLYQLGVVAIPHDQSTRLVHLTVDQADPTSFSPTGLTLTFSGPIDLSKLFEPDAQEGALEVVDSSGTVWPITAESYQVTNAQLSLIFDQPLPAGNYTLIETPGGGFSDLAGMPVVAPGQPAGVLGSWTVQPSSPSHNSNNLGVIWPSTANVTWPTNAGAFHRVSEIAPGQEATYRWVVTVPGFFSLQTKMTSGQLTITNFGNVQTTVLASNNTQQLSTYLFRLNDGTYYLRFQNTGSQPLAVSWVLKIGSLDWEKILDNGVAQSSALTLSLFSQPSTDSGSESSTNSQASVTPVAAGNFTGFSSSGPITASLFITTNTSLIGQPTVWSQNVAPVGPTVEGGLVATADNSNDLGEGAGLQSIVDTSRWYRDDQLARTERPDAEPRPVPAVHVASTVDSPWPDPTTSSVRADERALAQADWLISLGARLKDWFASPGASAGADALAATSSSTSGMVQNDRSQARARERFVRGKHTTSTAQADVGAVLGLMTVGVVAYRLRRPLQHWWQQKGRPSASVPAPSRVLCRGPHPITTRTRAVARVSASQSVR